MSRLFYLLLAALTAAAQPAEVKLTVAAVQFRSSFKISDNRRGIVDALNNLAQKGVQVAVFPECALTGYNTAKVVPSAEEISAAEEEIRQTCRLRRIAAIVGSAYHVNGRTYNTAVVFDSRGTLIERYGKLIPAGEKWATPGNHIAFFDLEGLPSTVIVCRDKRSPELVRLPAMAGARILYYIGHETGVKYEARLKPLRAQTVARAAENSIYTVASIAPGDVNDTGNSHGQSRIIRNDGVILQEASIFGEDILIETLSIKPGKLKTPPDGLMAGWWREGLDLMMKNRGRKLE